MVHSILRNKVTYIIIGIYVTILAWWLRLQILHLPTPEVYFFNWSYGLIGLIGGLYTVFNVSKIWGGYKSVIGKALIFISLGLLGQWFGLQVWTYYNVILKNEIPYPSVADVGYFSLVPFYTIGAFMLAKAVGARLSLETTRGKITVFIIPLAMLLFAYFLFVKDIGWDTGSPIKAFFDFGYPLGEVIPVSIAIFTLSLAKKFFGGRMTSRILYLIFAFAFQFFTEYMFLYSSGLNVYANGGYNDLLYATSYTIMVLGLISFKNYE